MRAIFALIVSSVLAIVSTAAGLTAAQLKQIGDQTLRGEVMEITQGKVNGGTEYLAAIYDSPSEGMRVAVIRRVGNAYTVVHDESACCIQNSDVQITDANRDGHPEVFYSGAGGGTGITTYDFYLTNLRDKKLYHAFISVGNNSGRGTLHYDPALLQPANSSFLNVMQPFIEQSEGFKTTKLPPTLDEVWTQQYGRFASEHWAKMQITPRPAALSSAACALARPYLAKPDSTISVRVGNILYAAAFKGPVYAIDTKKKQCYVVYMPKSYYDWINPMKLMSNGSIAFYDRTDPRIVVYFNPKTNTLWR